jgi:site-specific recombinase XerD
MDVPDSDFPVPFCDSRDAGFSWGDEDARLLDGGIVFAADVSSANGVTIMSNPKSKVIEAEGSYPARVSGPLAAEVHVFRAELVRAGYTARVGQDNAYVMACLSRWLEAEGLMPSDLTAGRLERFALARREEGYRRWRTVRSLRLLLQHLRGKGLVPAEEQPEADGPAGRILDAFGRYLRTERQLAERTVRLRVHLVRPFLAGLAGPDGTVRLDQVSPAAVAAFVAGQAGVYAIGSVKQVTVALRSLLRYLFAAELIDRDLSPSVPPVAGWRMSGLPGGAGDGDVAAMLAGCDRSTVLGARDFAVLMLMSRLGLRACEVARLRLDDLDWRSGELAVRGKGGRVDRLPLPADVGGAVAGYLRLRRSPSACREVFLRTCGPDAPMSRQSAVMVPRRAGERAGLPAIGAHRLRHRAATLVVNNGGSLAEAAQLLRHGSETVTAIYAKVDRSALAAVACPWPEA